MIKTNVQYNQLKKKIETFQVDLKSYKEELETKNLNPIQKKLYIDIFEREHDKRIELVKEYEKVKDRKVHYLTINKAADIPKILIKARIAEGWSQKELADKFMIHEQQVQRIEQNDYLNTSFERVIQALELLNLDIFISKNLKQNINIKLSKYTNASTEAMKARGSILPICN